MNFYQELQLDAAKSKEIIKNSKSSKEKAYHIAVFMLKVIITVSFCVVSIIVFSAFFGDENRMAGVVILVSVLMFRNVDLDICIPHSVLSITIIYALITFGPKLANIANPFIALFINIICIMGIMIFGCHNLTTYNQCILVLGYLLMYGYDVSGKAYLLRVAGMAVGTLLIILVYCFKHRKKTFSRTLKNIFKEFNIRSTRTSWQITMTLAISTLFLIADLIGMPRPMWAGIAVMSVLVPFRENIIKRSVQRSIGNIAGGAVFTAIFHILPDSVLPLIGIFGGIGAGFSATYKWQSMFNSLGAISVAVLILGGLREAVFIRIFNNVIGAVYGILFGIVFYILIKKIVNKWLTKPQKIC